MPPCFEEMPLIAILRGLHPDEAVAVGRVISDAGFRILEVPMNSPEPLESIRRLTATLGDRCMVGAGTVLSVDAVEAVAAAGGRLVVMPHADPQVIRATKRAGLCSVPGVATVTEAFTALQAGADALKAFPAELIAPPVLRAWRAVLPADLDLLPVGGITPENMADYRRSGATGFGIGSSLYAPGRALETISQTARRFVEAWRARQR